MTNTTLHSLNLRGEQEGNKEDGEFEILLTTNTNKQRARVVMKEQEH